MKIKNIFIYTLVGLCSAPMAVNAQVTLSDKSSQKVDLGYGVEQSELLTTAARTLVSRARKVVVPRLTSVASKPLANVIF